MYKYIHYNTYTIDIRYILYTIQIPYIRKYRDTYLLWKESFSHISERFAPGPGAHGTSRDHQPKRRVGISSRRVVSSRFEFAKFKSLFLFFSKMWFSRNIFMFQVDIWCLCKHIWTGLQRFDASILTTSHKTDVMYFWYIINLYEIYTIYMWLFLHLL